MYPCFHYNQVDGAKNQKLCRNAYRYGAQLWQRSTHISAVGFGSKLATQSAVRKNTIYKLTWWIYTVRHDTMHYYDVVGYSSSDVTLGAL